MAFRIPLDGDATLSHEEIFRYSRHLLMPEVGLEGQQRLKASSVLMVGAGGLGSPIALYLAAAGIGRIGMIDCGDVELSNLQRQVLYDTAHDGQSKVEIARERLLALNPTIDVEVYRDPFTSDNAESIVATYALVIDGTDNFPTRYLINDVCVLLGKPFVHGSIYRFEGQVSTFWAEHGPCYRCLFPDPPPPGSVPSCAEGGVFGVLPGTVGTIQATEALKLLLGVGEPLIGRLLLYDSLTMGVQTLALTKNPACKACSPTPEITELVDYEAFCGVPGYERAEDLFDAEMAVAPRELAEVLDADPALQLVDVREPHEWQISRIDRAASMPLGSLAARLHELDSAREVVLFCKEESRAARALELLLGAGFRKVRVMQGGINAWAKQVDPALPRY